VTNGANVNQFDNSGRTPLIEVIFLGNIKMIDLLLKNEADVNKINFNTGDTALILAVGNNNYDIAKLLFIQY